MSNDPPEVLCEFKNKKSFNVVTYWLLEQHVFLFWQLPNVYTAGKQTEPGSWKRSLAVVTGRKRKKGPICSVLCRDKQLLTELWLSNGNFLVKKSTLLFRVEESRQEPASCRRLWESSPMPARRRRMTISRIVSVIALPSFCWSSSPLTSALLCTWANPSPAGSPSTSQVRKDLWFNSVCVCRVCHPHQQEHLHLAMHCTSPNSRDMKTRVFVSCSHHGFYASRANKNLAHWFECFVQSARKIHRWAGLAKIKVRNRRMKGARRYIRKKI